jgi:hypothetical protein
MSPHAPASAALACLVLAACTPHVERTSDGLNVNSIPFGPRVQIGGLDDDNRPVTVDVDRGGGRGSVVRVEAGDD